MRIGCVIARRIPAIAFASVCRAAKPTTSPSTADDASTPVATRLIAANWASASASPMTMIPAKISRRTSRSRVVATGESSPAPTASPRVRPRLAIARSTSFATTKASTTVAPAVISLRYSSQEEAAMRTSAAGMAHEAISGPSRPRAVLLDALGTLIRLEPPAPRLRAELRRRAGARVSEARAARAFRVEIEYYLAHHLEGRDERSLAELRERCAEVLGRELELEGLESRAVREAMLAALSFVAYPDAPSVLRRLRERGLRLVAASNWDCSLPLALERAGVLSLLDGVVASAAVGAAKPRPELFQAALRAAGVGAAGAVHVGDSVEHDVEGALAAGLRAVLVVRDGPVPPLPAGAGAIRGLAELPSLISR